MTLPNESIIYQLTELGAAFHFDQDWIGEVGTRERRPVENRERIMSVYVPLTPQEWCNLCMREGDEYIGGCCGQTGVTQDILNEIFRDGGFIEARFALELTEVAAGHDGFDILTERNEEVLLKEASKWEELLALDKIFLCVAAAFPRLNPNSCSAASPNRTEDKDGVGVLAQTLSILRWDGLVSPSEDQAGQTHGNKMMWIARSLPGLKLFNNYVESALKEEWRGYAIVNSANEIQRNGYGYTVFSSEESAQEMMQLWHKMDTKKDDEHKNPELAEYRIKPVTMSMEGIKIND